MRMTEFLIVAILMPPTSSACSCMWSGPLLTSAQDKPLIVRAKVLSYHGKERGVALAMNIQILETFKGAAESAEIRVYGDNGFLCRPYVSSFPLQSEWVFAISRSEGGGYEIVGCGTNWAKVENGVVIGELEKRKPLSEGEKPERMSLPKIRGRLSAKKR